MFAFLKSNVILGLFHCKITASHEPSWYITLLIYDKIIINDKLCFSNKHPVILTFPLSLSLAQILALSM